LADKNFTAIASAITLKPGKITFTNKDTIYEIVPYEDILEQLDSIMADPALAVRGQDCLYKHIQALHLLGISRPSVMEYLNKDMVHLALTNHSEEDRESARSAWAISQGAYSQSAAE